MRLYRCPTRKRWPGDVVGCGYEFMAEPDKEGLIDCPNCGIWFTAPRSHRTLRIALAVVLVLAAFVISVPALLGTYSGLVTIVLLIGAIALLYERKDGRS